MEFNQDDKTKKFLQRAKILVESGVEPTYKAIAEKIGWNHNSLSLTINGRRNVPFEVYKKFTELYKEEEPDVQYEDWKDQQIAFLKEQNRYLKEQVAELKDRMDSRTLQLSDQIQQLAASLTEMSLNLKSGLAYAKTMYSSMIEHRVWVEGENQKVLKSKMDKLLDEHFAHTLEKGNR